ncbi:hypothetical protein [Acrocarpospora sp. B8E8]
MRRVEEAVTAFQQAAAIFHELGDRHSEDIAMSNLSATQEAQNR